MHERNSNTLTRIRPRNPPRKGTMAFTPGESVNLMFAPLCACRSSAGKRARKIVEAEEIREEERI